MLISQESQKHMLSHLPLCNPFAVICKFTVIKSLRNARESERAAEYRVLEALRPDD